MSEDGRVTLSRGQVGWGPRLVAGGGERSVAPLLQQVCRSEGPRSDGHGWVRGGEATKQ